MILRQDSPTLRSAGRRALRTALHAGRLGIAYSSYLRSLARAPSYLRERRGEADRLKSARRVAIFAHYDGQGALHDYVHFYLQEIADAGFAIIFVSNAPRLSPPDLARLEEVCALVLRRDNVGYDFGAYKEAVAQIPDLGALDCLLLTNDSVYGPFHRLDHMLDRMDPDGADVWGVTDSWEFSYHLQSYFMLFHRRALASPVFRAFWDDLRYV